MQLSCKHGCLSPGRLPAGSVLEAVWCAGMQVPGAFAIDANLLPDTLHPNRVGFKMLLDKCFEPALYGDGGAGAVQGLEPG